MPRTDRRLAAVLAAIVTGLVAATLIASTAAASPPAPEPEGSGAEAPLVPIPPGCPAPDPADVAFVGVVLDKDGYIERGLVRFQIDEVRAGNAAPFAVDGVIDVRYGPDSKYLEIDEQYLVSAAVDPDLGQLASKVSPATPLFGGNDVIGVEDSAVDCPTLDDPVQTLHVDGTPVESGVVTPMFQDTKVLLATLGVPLVIVFAVLIGLVILRILWRWAMSGVFALGRAAVTPTTDQRATRVRRHRPGSAQWAIGRRLDAARRHRTRPSGWGEDAAPQAVPAGPTDRDPVAAPHRDPVGQA